MPSPTKKLVIPTPLVIPSIIRLSSKLFLTLSNSCMKTLSRCKVKPRSNSGLSSKLFSNLADAKPNDMPREQDNASMDANVTEVSNLQTILQLCARKRAPMEAKACHGKIIRFRLREDSTTLNVLINAYSKCGLFVLARKVFDEMSEKSLVSWNTMIGSYTQNGGEREALGLFCQMKNKGIEFNEITLSSVLCACGLKCDVLECKQLHGFAVKTCMDSNIFVGTAMLDLYAKCGFIVDATEVFESMNERSSVTWSSMVAGYVQNKLYEEALMLFHRSQNLGWEHNQYTISSVICACSNLAALIEGRQIHAILSKTGFGSNVFVASSLIDMYAKCGNIRDAYIVFSGVQEKNVVLWNAMISGFAKHARSVEVMILFEKMQQNGIYPNEVTFSSLLSACGHMGLVEKGQRFFQLMKTEHNLSTNVLHYSCMVDILGRAGLISEAYELIRSMSFDPTASIWGSLLASCRVYGNLDLAEIAANKLFELEPENAGNHALLSNIYAANKKWEAVARSRKILRDSKVKKVRGKSWIEIKTKVHAFSVGEREHPRIHEICSKLEDLVDDMKRFGYEPGIEHELHDVEESKKKELLRHHSEKLAFAFGLMCLPLDAPVRIMKNLRICGDCHSFMKVASRVTGREILVRDVNRFHHFRTGSCSCGEFW